MGTAANRSRAIFAGGEPETSTMTSFTFASLGNFTHDGQDLTERPKICHWNGRW